MKKKQENNEKLKGLRKRKKSNQLALLASKYPFHLNFRKSLREMNARLAPSLASSFDFFPSSASARLRLRMQAEKLLWNSPLMLLAEGGIGLLI